MSWAQCSPCGRIFTSVSGFDRHQEYHFGTSTPVVCLDPATLGMVQNEAGRWHFPETAASRLRLAKMRAERDQSGVTGSEAGS